MSFYDRGVIFRSFRLVLRLYYSRGQPKPSKKKGKLMMAEKMIGKHANRLSEARGQFSS